MDLPEGVAKQISSDILHASRGSSPAAMFHHLFDGAFAQVQEGLQNAFQEFLQSPHFARYASSISIPPEFVQQVGAFTATNAPPLFRSLVAALCVPSHFPDDHVLV